VAFKGCIPCPPHGRCDNGDLFCDETYIRKGDHCIENVELNRNAMTILDVSDLLSFYMLIAVYFSGVIQLNNI
jgi:hypothetical protein